MAKTPVKYHGSKGNLAAWLQSHAPAHCRVDPENGYTHRNIIFAGGLGELWTWDPVEDVSESVNDISLAVSAFWAVLQDENLFLTFERVAYSTPFSEVEFRRASNILAESSRVGTEFSSLDSDDLLKLALAFFVSARQSRQGVMKSYATPTRRLRRGRNENVSAWQSALDNLPEFHDRMLNVEVRCLDFEEYILAYDHPRSLFYADPPYLHSTRVTTTSYGYEMSVADHERLLKVLSGIEGRFMLSGYDSELYADYAVRNGWRVVTKEVTCSSSSKKKKDSRTEYLWMNY